MKNKKFKNILSIILIGLIIMVFAFIFSDKITQNDLFFDIRSGKDLLRYGLDFKDHFSFIPNLTYLYHHYLYDILIYFVHKFLGFKGIFIFFLIILTILGFTVYFVNYRYSKNKFISLLIAILTLFVLKGYIPDRVQVLTYILFFINCYFLEELYETGKKRYIVFLALSSILIVNLHMPLWILTVIFAIPYLFEFLIKYISITFPKLLKIVSDKITLNLPKKPPLFILGFIVLLLTGLISPHKFYPYIFFLKTLGNESFSIILEMQKTTFIINSNLVSLSILMLIIVFLINSKVKLRDLLLLLGLLLFSQFAIRNISYVYLFYPTILAKILVENYKLPEIKSYKLKKITKFLAKFYNPFILIALILCVSVSYVYCFIGADFKNFDYGINDNYPVKSVQYIKENLNYKDIKLYTEFNYGSYVAFNDIPIFIDSRAEVYIKEFNGGTDVMSDYINIYNYSLYKDIFEKYNFDYALVYFNSDLYTYLMNDSDFKLLYTENDQFALFKC